MWLILLFILIAGLCIGSFLNVVILRAISNESIVFPGSKCPKCQHPLKWWHNIPVLSYIILRGKCGFCKEKISIQYPIIEILTAIVFVLVSLRYGITPSMIYGWVIASLLIVIAVTDWKEQMVYEKHVYTLIGTGIIYSAVVTVIMAILYISASGFSLNTYLLTSPITLSLLGTILGFVVMEIVARLGYLVAGDRAFGEGDSYIAAGLGAVFGWKMLIPILILSVIIQVIITIPVFIKKEIQSKNWMALISLGIFSLYAAAFFMAEHYGWLSSTWAYVISAVILCALGLFSCREILVGLKNPENRTYLPFGPAMVLAGMIALLIV